MTETTSLMEISRRCFMAVGPSRIAACALTILDDAACETDIGRARFETARDRIATAQRMLEEGWLNALQVVDRKMSPDLASAHQEAAACIAILAEALQGPPETLTQRMGGKDRFQDFFFELIEPLVTTFLEKMTSELETAHAARIENQRTEALEAVRNADNVGRTISLIAVNAGIEAARSGDNGFKIIADEIKALAIKTQTQLRKVGQAMQQT